MLPRRRPSEEDGANDGQPDRGLTSAALGVDAENPSGALGLYQGVGFGVERQAAAYRKPLD